MARIHNINWLLYKQYCRREGLSEGNYKSLRKYIER